ncbi:MAG: PH domain-containing protein [Acidobacteriota bacterium]
MEQPPAPFPVADGRDHPLDPGWLSVARLSASFGALLLAFMTLPIAVAMLWNRAFPWPFVVLGWGGLVTLLAVRAWWWPAVRYRHMSYRVDGWGVRIRRGVFWRSVASVPKARVQHTDVSRGPLQRRFGIATLVIHTAGTQYAAIPLPGLTHATALAIRDHLIDGEGEDAV